MKKRSSVLILCTGNSCRSQMAEGFLREAAGASFDVYSAGSAPAERIHPRAAVVMKEVGIDLSGHRPRHVREFLEADVDVLITVCEDANEACPVFPGGVDRYHWGFEDPSRLDGTDEEIAAAFRKTRDEIRRVFEAFAAGFRAAAKTSAH